MRLNNADNKIFDLLLLQQKYLSAFRSELPAKFSKLFEDKYTKALENIAESSLKVDVNSTIKKLRSDLLKLLERYKTLVGEEFSKIAKVIYDSTKEILSLVLYGDFRTEEVKKKDDEKFKAYLLIAFKDPLSVTGTKGTTSHRFSTYTDNVFYQKIKEVEVDMLERFYSSDDDFKPTTSIPRMFTYLKNLLQTFYFNVLNWFRRKVFSEEKKVQAYRYTAILDDRTTHLCRSLDGTIRKDINQLPQPPLHWHCRSTIVPITSNVEYNKDLDFKDFNSWFDSLPSNEKNVWLESGLLSNPINFLSLPYFLQLVKKILRIS